MQKLIIKGNKTLSGTIKISGSKNATLPILASTILSDKKIEINNIVPKAMGSGKNGNSTTFRT